MTHFDVVAGWLVLTAVVAFWISPEQGAPAVGAAAGFVLVLACLRFGRNKKRKKFRNRP